MAYGLKYYFEFKNRQNDTFTVNFLQKDYTGTSEELEAAGDPAILDYGSGDEKAYEPLRPSTATFSYFNNGSHPLDVFVSNNDDQFKVEVLNNGDICWTGFVVQDDATQPFSKAAPYQVSIRATDNLALLKDVSYLDAVELITGVRDIAFEKNDLREYLITCLNATGLTLPLNTYNNLFEDGMDDRHVSGINEPLNQAFVDVRTFLKDENEWLDCYTIIERILSSWNLTLFQAEGEWHIVRWMETKDFNNAIPGTRIIGLTGASTTVALDNVKNIGLGQEICPINANQTSGLKRASKEVRLTYNYEFPSPLIRNYNFSELGTLFNTYTIGTDTINEYTMPYWFDYTGSPVPQRFIRVTVNQYGTETERVAVIAGSTFDSARSARSDIFEANADDRLQLSFEFRTSDSQPGNVNVVFAVAIYNPVTLQTWYARNDGTWTNGTIGWTYNVPSGDNTNVFHQVNIDTGPIPFDGQLFFYLAQADLSSTYNETIYKSVSLTYYSYVDSSVKVNGQQHSSRNLNAVKKVIAETLYLDDSRKNATRGTMFLPNLTTKTTQWRFSEVAPITTDFQIYILSIFKLIRFVNQPNLYTLFKYNQSVVISGTTSNNVTVTVLSGTFLGNENDFSVLVDGSVTAETVTGGTLTITQPLNAFGYWQKLMLMYLNDETRTKVEGDFFGLKDSNGNVSLKTIFTYAGIERKYFILGRVTFNLMKATFNGILEEMWYVGDDNVLGEAFNPTGYTNTFKYLYK